MIIEVASAGAFAGIFLAAKMKQNGGGENDHEKIKEIADQCNLKTKNQSIRIHRKSKKERYTEYVYQIPLGLSLNDFLTHLDRFNDGLNNKKRIKTVEWKNLKQIRKKDFKGRTLPQIVKHIKGILQDSYITRKHVQMFYDGMLRVRVYNQSIPDMLLFSEDLWNDCKPWHIPIGEDQDGLRYIRLDDGHTVVAGTTRYGKTTIIHLMINTFINNHSDDVEFTLLDLKSGLSFQRYYHCKQVVNTAETLEQSYEALQSVMYELDKRKEAYKRKGLEKIQDDKSNEFKRHYVIIDEASNLDWQRAKNLHSKEDVAEAKRKFNQCRAWMKQIACEAAGLGIYLVFSTQYPTTEILDSQVKANTINKICFRLDNAIQSGVVLDEGGAETIKQRGRAIVRTPDGTDMIQTFFMDNKQIDRNIKPHINIRPRKEKQNEKEHQEHGTTGKDSLIIEEIGIC